MKGLVGVALRALRSVGALGSWRWRDRESVALILLFQGCDTDGERGQEPADAVSAGRLNLT